MGKYDESRRSPYPQVQGAGPIPDAPPESGASAIFQKYRQQEEAIKSQWRQRAQKQGLQPWEADVSIEAAMSDPSKVPQGYQDLYQQLRQARVLKEQAQRTQRGI